MLTFKSPSKPCGVLSKTMLKIISICSLISCTIRPHILSLTMLLIISKVPLINSTISPRKLTQTMLHVISHLADVGAAIRPLKLDFADLATRLPLPGIHST